MSKEKWHLLHEKEPVHEARCYWGYKDRTSRIFLTVGTWDVETNDWTDKDSVDCPWGWHIPALLPIDIFWCRAEDFSSSEEALSSLSALVGLPTDNQGVE